MERRLYTGPDLQRAQSIEELRAIARKRVPNFCFEYVEGGAEEEISLRRNREVFSHIGFLPRTLVDVSVRRQARKLATYSCVSEKSTSKAARKKDIHKTRAAEAEYEKTGQAPDGDGAHAVDTPAVNAGVGDAVATSDEKAEKHDVNHDVADVLETW